MANDLLCDSPVNLRSSKADFSELTFMTQLRDVIKSLSILSELLTRLDIRKVDSNVAIEY